MEKNQTAVVEKPVSLPVTVQAGATTAVRRESHVEEMESGQGSHVEYTELALDCLDLKAQQELLSPSVSAGKMNLLKDNWITSNLKSSQLLFSFYNAQFQSSQACCDLYQNNRILCVGLAAYSEVAETDLAEELPLCCCRMETPNSRGGLSALDQTCMAMESADGTVKINQNNKDIHGLIAPGEKSFTVNYMKLILFVNTSSDKQYMTFYLAKIQGQPISV